MLAGEESRPLAITVSDLCWEFEGLKVINGLSLNVHVGESVGIIGPNGSGKTSLFNCLSGFSTPKSGSISLNGRDVTALTSEHRARLGLGRVFQNSGIFRDMTVLENLQVAMESSYSWLTTLLPWNNRSKQIRTAAHAKLTEIGLGDKAHQRASVLSGGQLRVLEIARALAFGSQVLLLDEPTAGVAPKMRIEVATLLQGLISSGKTVLVIEHDLAFIQQFCNRMVVIDSGRVVLDGPTAEIRGNPLLREIYFGSGVA